MVKPSSIHRPIPVEHFQRASRVEDIQVGPYLDAILVEMHQALDGWRYGKEDDSRLQLATDAFLALLAVTEARGLTK